MPTPHTALQSSCICYNHVEMLQMSRVDVYGDNLQSCVRCCRVGILRNLRNNIISDLLYSAFNLRHNIRCHLSFILKLVRSLAVTCFQLSIQFTKRKYIRQDFATSKIIVMILKEVISYQVEQ
jgi:hypothetical protein